MAQEPTAPVELATFDPPVARAVASVLRRAGIDAEVANLEAAEQAGGEAAVLVAPTHREAALAMVARRMEDVRAHVLEHERHAAPPQETVADWHDDDLGHGRPLVLERLRKLGFIGVALVPVLIVTLANVRLPAAYIAALIIGGVVLLTAWRNGRFGGT